MVTSEPTVRPRGRPRDPEVDTGILNAAIALLTEGGFEKLTMEAVACRAGVAKASIYRRFPSKVDLIVAMCHAFTPETAPDIDTGSIRSDLVALVTALAETMSDSSDTGRLMPSMLGAAKENPEVREALAEFSASRRTRTANIVRRAIERGELSSKAHADVIGDLIVGAVIYRTMIRNDRVDRAFTETIVDGILDGFGTDDGRSGTPAR